MATTTQQASAVVKGVLKIKSLWHFNCHWVSTDNVTKIVEPVLNLSRSNKMFFDSNLISRNLFRDLSTNMG